MAKRSTEKSGKKATKKSTKKAAKKTGKATGAKTAKKAAKKTAKKSAKKASSGAVAKSPTRKTASKKPVSRKAASKKITSRAGNAGAPDQQAKKKTPRRVTRAQAAAQGPEGSTNPPSAIADRLEDANAARQRGHVSQRTRRGQARRDQY